MGQFDRQIATAKKLISKNGQAVIWQSSVITEDLLKPWRPSEEVIVKTPVEICFLPATKQSLEYMGLTEVPTGCVLGLMGQVAFEPSLSDVVIRDGVQLRIEKIDILSPNGQKILYTMIFKL